MKKILFFLPSLAGGGAERTVVQLANSFSNIQNYSVQLLVCSLHNNKSELIKVVNDDVKIINLDCNRVSKALLPLAKILKKENYDYLISTQTHTNIASIVAKKIARVPVKVILREVSTPSMNIKAKGVKLNILKDVVRFTYKHAYKVVCVSTGVLNNFKDFYDYEYDNILTIYNPVIDEGFIKQLNAPVQHKFFEPELKVILGIGRLTEAKNFPLLIRAFSKLYEKHPECRLIILGEGHLRPDLQNIIQDLGLNNVIDLPGFVINPYGYFKYCETFVLSSDWEGLPGVLIQALYSKVKVISTNCPSGPSEVLNGGKYGILVECNDTNAIFKALQSSIFGNYISYNEKDLQTHCKLFEVNHVVSRYLRVMKI